MGLAAAAAPEATEESPGDASPNQPLRIPINLLCAVQNVFDVIDTATRGVAAPSMQWSTENAGSFVLAHMQFSRFP